MIARSSRGTLSRILMNIKHCTSFFRSLTSLHLFSLHPTAFPPFCHAPAMPLQEFVGADGDNDNAEVSTPDVVESVAQLLHLEGSEELSFALTTLRTTTRGG